MYITLLFDFLQFQLCSHRSVFALQIRLKLIIAFLSSHLQSIEWSVRLTTNFRTRVMGLYFVLRECFHILSRYDCLPDYGRFTVTVMLNWSSSFSFFIAHIFGILYFSDLFLVVSITIVHYFTCTSICSHNCDMIAMLQFLDNHKLNLKRALKQSV